MRHATLPALAATLLLSACQPSGKIGEAPPLEPEFSPAPLPDFSEFSDVQAKKQAFFGYLEPMVVHQNQHLAALREHLLKLEQGFAERGELHPEDQAWLAQLAKRFRVESDDTAVQLSRLKRKVDRIPAALVLAQAANESAWGTSRFARDGNNLFGMWCFQPGCGLTPLQRDSGAAHEVAAYPNIETGINRYLVNLNANPSYRGLRKIRSCLEQHQQEVSGRALAAGLSGYSERGGHYITELQAMIRINQLEPWAEPWWGDSAPDHPCYPLVQVVIDTPDPIAPPAASEAAASPSASAAVSSAAASQGVTGVADDSSTASAAAVADSSPADANPAASAATPSPAAVSRTASAARRAE